MEKIIKVKMNSEPQRLRGVSPEKLNGFTGDPDTCILNPRAARNLDKIYESCKPKFTERSGTIIVFGTGGPLN